jgi:hypothetical protein
MALDAETRQILKEATYIDLTTRGRKTGKPRRLRSPLC